MSLIEDAVLQSLQEIEQHGTYPDFRPLSQAADEFIEWAMHPENRIYTGIGVLDDAMRGTAPGELTLIQGFSHSGKTLVATEMLLANPDEPIVLFTPDETRPLVLTKLTAATHGVDARELERRIQQDDENARTLLLETAEKYGKLAVFDQEVTVRMMERMLEQVTSAMGEKPKAFVFDYADLLSGMDDVRNKISALKFFGKEHGLAAFVLHQASRSGGGSGRKMTMESGGYGGEQQATHVIGVRRKKMMYLGQIGEFEMKIAQSSNPASIVNYEDKIRELHADAMLHENTVTVSLVKNKRPPCILVDDVDFRLEPSTGRLVLQPHRPTAPIQTGSAVSILRSRWDQQVLEDF